MPNEATDSQESGVQSPVDRFTDFIGDSIRNKAKLILKPVNGDGSECLLVSQKPNEEDKTLIVSFDTASAVVDASDLEDLDRLEGLKQEQIQILSTSSIMAIRIMEKTAPKTTS